MFRIRVKGPVQRLVRFENGYGPAESPGPGLIKGTHTQGRLMSESVEAPFTCERHGLGSAEGS